ncbi:MAG: hypothetical protein WC592_07725 [Candidatus Omnitrophota bacterium]
MKYPIVILCVLAIVASGAVSGFSEELLEYKRFKLEQASCDVGLLYRPAPEGMTLGVSAIATGKGAEFRKWKISGIKLNIGGERIRPDSSGKFFVKEESLFRIPAAVVFAAIGTQVHVSGSGLEQGIGKAGMAIGLGLLVLAADGDIPGEQCVFKLNTDQMEAMKNGLNSLEIGLVDDNVHPNLRETIRVGVAVPQAPQVPDFNAMSRDELIGLVDSLEGQVAGLEKDQRSYKYGVDPEYDEIGRTIEKIQTERGMAYKAWVERQDKKEK